MKNGTAKNSDNSHGTGHTDFFAQLEGLEAEQLREIGSMLQMSVLSSFFFSHPTALLA